MRVRSTISRTLANPLQVRSFVSILGSDPALTHGIGPTGTKRRKLIAAGLIGQYGTRITAGQTERYIQVAARCLELAARFRKNDL